MAATKHSGDTVPLVEKDGDGGHEPWVRVSAQAASTTGGTTPYSFLSTAAVLAAAIKASAGQIYSMQLFNLNAAARYVRLYNKATAPLTTDTPIWRGMIPGGGTTVGSGVSVSFPNGLAFATGIGIRVTAAVADNDDTALAANEITGNVQYK